MLAVVFWAAMATLSPGLRVETGSPDALCPDLAAAQAAVMARLGVVGVNGHAGWTARYTSWHAPDQEGDFVRLEVTDPSGIQRLVRDLPLAGESCSTMAQVIALVLDRYFRELDGPGRAAPAPEKTPPASAPRRGPRWLLGLAGGAMPQLGVLGNVAVEGQHVGLSLQSGWSPFLPDEPLAGSEVASMTTSVPLRLAGEGLVRLGRVQIHMGPELFCAYERASATLKVPGANSRLAIGPGLRLGVALPLGRRLRLTADASLDRVMGGGRFMVDDSEVLSFPWRVLVALGVQFAVGDEGI
jgi:hypothetical protein